jgi:hypothetical protein
VAGSADNDGARDGHGKVIHFPRSNWVPDDGVEPLTGEPAEPIEPAKSTTATLEPPSRDREAFEPDDFWDSGDTQQFVGTGGSPKASTSAQIDEPPVAVRSTAGDGAVPTVSESGSATRRRAIRIRALLARRPPSLSLPARKFGLAFALVAVLGAGAIAEILTAGGPSKPAFHAATASSTEPLIRHRPWVARGVKPHALSTM